jgi:hypothetical protein
MPYARSDAHTVRNEQIRTLFQNLDNAKGLPSTSEVVNRQGEALEIAVHVENVPSAKKAKIHWLGDTTAKEVLLYFHGTNVEHLFCAMEPH